MRVDPCTILDDKIDIKEIKNKHFSSDEIVLSLNISHYGVDKEMLRAVEETAAVAAVFYVWKHCLNKKIGKNWQTFSWRSI